MAGSKVDSIDTPSTTVVSRPPSAAGEALAVDELEDQAGQGHGQADEQQRLVAVARWERSEAIQRRT